MPTFKHQHFNSIRVESLDALRGLLAVIVFVAHAWQTFVYPFENGISTTFWILGLMARGAVLGFFCLSGYVITLSVEKNILRNGKFSISDYFNARFFRIVPPLFAVMILTLIISICLDFIGASKISNAVLAPRHIYETNFSSQVLCLLSACAFGDLTGKGFNGPLWSLVFEVQLYAISALLTLFITSTKRLSSRLLILIILVLFAFSALKLHQGFSLNIQIISYLCFLSGSLVYINYHKLNKVAIISMLGYLSIFAVITGYSASSIGSLANMDSKNWLLFQLTLGAIFSFALVGISKFNLLNKFKSLGRYSYTLYIFHFPLFMMIYFILYTFTPNFLATYSFFIFLMAIFIIGFLIKKLGLFLEQSKLQRNFLKKMLSNFSKKQTKS